MKKVLTSALLSLCTICFASCSVTNRINPNVPDEIDPNEYVPTVETYQITFLNGNGAQMYNQKLNKGESLAKIANSLLPTQESDGDYDYFFSGWSPEPTVVESDQVFVPKFKSVLHEMFTCELKSDNSGYILKSYNQQTPTEVTIPDLYGDFQRPIVEIAPGAFKDKLYLQSLILGSNIETIGEGAFENCSALSTIKYSASSNLTSIGDRAFSKCRKLKTIVPGANQPENTITFPNTLSTIGEQAFEGCAELNNITLGGNVSNIGSRVFKDCSSLTSLTVDTNNATYSSENSNIILNKQTGMVIAGCRTSSLTSTKIKGIGDYVFNGISFIRPNEIDPTTFDTVTSLVFPSNIVSFGEYSFANNSKLVSVTIQGNVTRIYQSTFEGCSFIETLKITGTSNDYFTDSNCIIRKAISDNTELPNGLSTPYLLYGTAGLTKLNTTILGIGEKAFYRSNIENIIFNSTAAENKITYIGAEAFRECKNLKTLKIRLPSVTANNGVLPVNLCRGCSSLTEITIPSYYFGMELGGDNTKGNGSFYDCTSLTTVNIHSNLGMIYENTFTNCRSITTVNYSGTSVIWDENVQKRNYKTLGNEYLINCQNKNFNVTAPFNS